LNNLNGYAKVKTAFTKNKKQKNTLTIKTDRKPHLAQHW